MFTLQTKRQHTLTLVCLPFGLLPSFTAPQGRSWIVRRSYEDFRVLDKHLHLCIYDRRFSQLPELPRFDSLRERAEVRPPSALLLALPCDQ